MSSSGQVLIIPSQTASQIAGMGTVPDGSMVFNSTINRTVFTNNGTNFSPMANMIDLGAKLSLSGGTMTGVIDMGGNHISNMANPSLAQDAATKSYVDSTTSSLMSITVISGSSFSMLDVSTINRYILQNTSLCTLTLPITMVVGHSLEIVGGGSAGWLIVQNSGQNITIGTSSSTVGSSGSIASTVNSDSLILTCSLSNAQWTGYGVQGNITFI